MKDMVEFGKKIKRLRQQRALSLRELGERSGVSYSFINSIEHNRFNPSRETVIALADTLTESDKDELLLLAGFAPTVEEALNPLSCSRSGYADSNSNSFSDSLSDSILPPLDVDDPEVSLFFKDFKNAPKDKRDEMLRFWNFIKDQHQARDSE
jgi:transcriptional regulator with XRE-family HTH domain